MIRHIVLLKLRAGQTVQDKEALDRRLAAFAASAPHADTYSVGTALALRPGHPRGAERVVEATFASAEALRRYLESPEHIALVRDVLDPACDQILSAQLPI